ncbi:hypothetical protein [Aeromonas caviae]|uniref:hypothetical protein n=1 Tax=Aeromonas caviae TaxID=648 RepID=UPI0030D80FE3
MTDSDLALFESSSYRNFPAGENGYTWAESHFDRPKGIRGDSRGFKGIVGITSAEQPLRELRSLLQLIQMTSVHLVLGQAAPASGFCP